MVVTIDLSLAYMIAFISAVVLVYSLVLAYGIGWARGR